MKPINMNVASIILFCIVFKRYMVNGLYLGDSCQMDNTGVQGVCKMISDCQSVINQITYEDILPTYCGFDDQDQTVCCPVEVNTRTTLRISQQSKWYSISNIFNLESMFVFNAFSICSIECQEYEDAKYERIWKSNNFNEKPVVQKIRRCGVSSAPLIVGGTEAKPHEFPHMVSSITWTKTALYWCDYNQTGADWLWKRRNGR